MATEHVNECVKLLNERLQDSELKGISLSLRRKQLVEALRSVFELVDLDWETQTGDKAELFFREGYEQCLVDVCEAIAQEWDVSLPPDPQRTVGAS
jgi:hypothetical protein